MLRRSFLQNVGSAVGAMPLVRDWLAKPDELLPDDEAFEVSSFWPCRAVACVDDLRLNYWGPADLHCYQDVMHKFYDAQRFQCPRSHVGLAWFEWMQSAVGLAKWFHGRVGPRMSLTMTHEGGNRISVYLGDLLCYSDDPYFRQAVRKNIMTGPDRSPSDVTVSWIGREPCNFHGWSNVEAGRGFAKAMEGLMSGGDVLGQYKHERVLSDGETVIAVMPLLGGRGRLIRGPLQHWAESYDDGW